MNFSQLLIILRARRKIILRTLCIVVGLTLAISLVWPNKYKATTSLVFNYKGVDPVTGVTVPAQLMPGYIATQVDIIGSKTVAMKVADELKLASIPSLVESFQKDSDGKGNIRDWLGDLLLKQINIAPSRESSVVDISYKGATPEFAAAVANAFANAYLQTSIELRVEPAKKASVYFTMQTKALRDKLEVAQQKLSKYQQEHGIVSTDNRLDVETARLNDLSTQLVMAQGQLSEASSRRRQVQGDGADESPDVMSNPLVQNLKASLAQAEAKFAQISQNLGVNHPQYQAAKAEVDKLRGELNRNVSSTSNSVANNAHILKRRELEIRAALEAQKAKVLELNRARDELTVLGKDVEEAQRAYDAASQRFIQTNLEGQSNQADVAVLSPATPPLDPSSPKVLLNIVLSIFMGTLLGLSLALVAELRDRRVRSATDLVEILQAPVLGVLEWRESTPVRSGLSKWRLGFRARSI